MSVFPSPFLFNILDQFGDSKQIIHALERKTLVSGIKNQVKINMQ